MVPSAFVRLAALPLSPSGKLDRRALPEDDPLPDVREAIVLPRTGVESVVAGIWADVLGRSPIGVEDDFFELGGHSLLATQVVSRLRDTFAIELPLRRVFEARTVEQLAEAVEDLVAEQIDGMTEEDATRLVGESPASVQESK
jgi:acyl carrier protein